MIPQVQPTPLTAIRQAYDQHGVEEFYHQFGETYRNPHEAIIHKLLQQCITQWQLENQLKTELTLDLACGSGEVTLALQKLDYTQIAAIDPYTGSAYFQRTGKTAEAYTFEQIADGILAPNNYSTIICSFALHLVSQSRLPIVAYQLSLIAKTLIVITPHKRPELKPAWGWQYQDEISLERVRSRLYHSTQIS